MEVVTKAVFTVIAFQHKNKINVIDLMHPAENVNEFFWDSPSLIHLNTLFISNRPNDTSLNHRMKHKKIQSNLPMQSPLLSSHLY